MLRTEISLQHIENSHGGISTEWELITMSPEMAVLLSGNKKKFEKYQCFVQPLIWTDCNSGSDPFIAGASFNLKQGVSVEDAGIIAAAWCALNMNLMEEYLDHVDRVLENKKH